MNDFAFLFTGQARKTGCDTPEEIMRVIGPQ
jgi:hypothetical protein